MLRIKALLKLSFFILKFSILLLNLFPTQLIYKQLQQYQNINKQTKVANEKMSQSRVRSSSTNLARSSLYDISSRSHYTKNFNNQIDRIRYKKYVPEIDGLDNKLMKMTGVFSSNVDYNPMKTRQVTTARPREYTTRFRYDYSDRKPNRDTHYDIRQDRDLMSYRPPMTRSKSTQTSSVRQNQQHKNYISSPYVFNNQNRNLKYKDYTKENKAKKFQYNIQQQQKQKQKNVRQEAGRQALKIKYPQNNLDCDECSAIKGKKQRPAQKNIQVIHVYHHHAKNANFAIQTYPMELLENNKNIKAIHHLAQNQNSNIELIKSTLNNKINKQVQHIQSQKTHKDDGNFSFSQKTKKGLDRTQKPLATKNKPNSPQRHNSSMPNSQLLQTQMKSGQAVKSSGITNGINKYLRNQIYKIGPDKNPNPPYVGPEVRKTVKQEVFVRKNNNQNSCLIKISEPKSVYIESQSSKIKLLDEQSQEQIYQNNKLKDSKLKAQANPQQEAQLKQPLTETKALSGSTTLRYTPQKQFMTSYENNNNFNFHPIDLTNQYEDPFCGNCCSKIKQDCAIF